MQKDTSACLWEELSAESEFKVDEGGQPVILCHHPKSKGFCDYRELTGESRSKACPLFQYTVPLHEVELEQHMEMLEPDRNKPTKNNQT